MAGRRKGEERRVNHDLFVGIRKWKHLDQARVRELYESPVLRDEAYHLVKSILSLAPDVEKPALEALAHSLIRQAMQLVPDSAIQPES